MMLEAGREEETTNDNDHRHDDKTCGSDRLTGRPLDDETCDNDKLTEWPSTVLRKLSGECDPLLNRERKEAIELRNSFTMLESDDDDLDGNTTNEHTNYHYTTTLSHNHKAHKPNQQQRQQRRQHLIMQSSSDDSVKDSQGVEPKETTPYNGWHPGSRRSGDLSTNRHTTTRHNSTITNAAIDDGE